MYKGCRVFATLCGYCLARDRHFEGRGIFLPNKRNRFFCLHRSISAETRDNLTGKNKNLSSGFYCAYRKKKT